MEMNSRSTTWEMAACAVMLSLATPTIAAAQFDDWLRVHSGPDYDFLVNPGSLAASPGDVDSLRVHRVIINRMLIRQREPERRRMVAWRQAAGLPTAAPSPKANSPARSSPPASKRYSCAQSSARGSILFGFQLVVAHRLPTDNSAARR